MKVSKKIKRLVVNVTEEEHQKLKLLAVKKNITISKMVMQSLTLFAKYYFPEN